MIIISKCIELKLVGCFTAKQKHRHNDSGGKKMDNINIQFTHIQNEWKKNRETEQIVFPTNQFIAVRYSI